MTRVLLIGLKPEAVDFSDPVLPPGMDAAKIQAGIDLGLKQMTDRGWQAEACLVEADDTAVADVQRQLANATYDCIVIGAGIRLPQKTLLLMEKILNAVHRAAPTAAIAFNVSPQDTGDAAARWCA